jgi:hypothetical protein
VLRLLYGSGLINGDKSIIDLSEDNLGGVTPYELLHLKKLASGGPFPVYASATTNLFLAELQHLLELGYILRRPGGSFVAFQARLHEGGTVDVKDYFFISEAGRDLLSLINQFESGRLWDAAPNVL